MSHQLIEPDLWILSPPSFLLHDKHSEGQRKVMVCSMSTTTVIVFLLSLIALEDFTVIAKSGRYFSLCPSILIPSILILATSNSFAADMAVYGCNYAQEHKRNEVVYYLHKPLNIHLTETSKSWHCHQELGASSQKWLRGRKMVEEVRSTVNTGAKHWIKEHEHGQDGRSSVGSEVRHQIRHSRVHFAGFVSFSSDYRAPKNHPPKHN